MKINSKGYIEPKVGDKFKIIMNNTNAVIEATLFNSDKCMCNRCIFYNEDNCIFACQNNDRDDNNFVSYKEIKD